MRRVAIAFVVALLTLPLVVSVAEVIPLKPRTPVAAVAEPLGVEVTVRPTGGSPYQLLRPAHHTYTCSATLTEAGSGKVLLSTREVIVSAGSKESVSATSGDLSLELRVGIGADASEARARATVRRGGRIVTEQRASVALLPRR